MTRGGQWVCPAGRWSVVEATPLAQRQRGTATARALAALVWVGGAMACAHSAPYTWPFSARALAEGSAIVVEELCSTRHFVVVTGRVVKVPRKESLSETFRKVGETLRATGLREVGLWSNCKTTLEGVCMIRSGLASGGVALVYMHTPSAINQAGNTYANLGALCDR